ncbi:N/A [soil metagenome]
MFVDELARRASAGSELATELLVEVIDGLGLARPGVRKILVDDDEAADALQDVLVAVAETIGSFRSESRFTTWLHQVARNKAVACLRRRGEPTMELGDHTGGAVRISSTIASRTTMAAVVAVLPHRYREAVILRDFEGLSYAEVATRLGLPLNTARTRIARGRALLARSLVAR